MNILITGGLGFIGTNLADRLLKDGHRVYLVDDLSTGRMRNLLWLQRNNKGSTWNIEDNDKLQFFEMDITHKEFVARMKFYEGILKIDQIYHLACPASPPKYYLDPLKTLDINYIGTKNVLEIANYYKARILFSSTSEVYGDADPNSPGGYPQHEDYNGSVKTTSPRSVYDEGKRVAETLVSEYCRQFNLETKIARIHNTAGPHMDPYDGRVLTNFILGALKEGKISIYGNGSQTRCFCHVSDMVDGLVILMNSDKFINEPVNIGTQNEISMLSLANEIKKIFPNIEYFFSPLPISDPKKRKPNIDKIKSIGWDPSKKLNQIIEDVIFDIKNEI